MSNVTQTRTFPTATQRAARGDHFANSFNAELTALCDAETGLRGQAVVCYRCHDRAWPRWTPLQPQHRHDIPPLPVAWEVRNPTSANREVVCPDCLGEVINGALKAMGLYLKSPAGQAALEAELREDEQAEAAQ